MQGTQKKCFEGTTSNPAHWKQTDCQGNCFVEETEIAGIFAALMSQKEVKSICGNFSILAFHVFFFFIQKMTQQSSRGDVNPTERLAEQRSATFNPCSMFTANWVLLCADAPVAHHFVMQWVHRSIKVRRNYLDQYIYSIFVGPKKTQELLTLYAWSVLSDKSPTAFSFSHSLRLLHPRHCSRRHESILLEISFPHYRTKWIAPCPKSEWRFWLLSRFLVLFQMWSYIYPWTGTLTTCLPSSVTPGPTAFFLTTGTVFRGVQLTSQDLATLSFQHCLEVLPFSREVPFILQMLSPQILCAFSLFLFFCWTWKQVVIFNYSFVPFLPESFLMTFCLEFISFIIS